jgi:hypothetical protein
LYASGSFADNEFMSAASIISDIFPVGFRKLPSYFVTLL